MPVTKSELERMLREIERIARQLEKYKRVPSLMVTPGNLMYFVRRERDLLDIVKAPEGLERLHREISMVLQDARRMLTATRRYNACVDMLKRAGVKLVVFQPATPHEKWCAQNVEDLLLSWRPIRCFDSKYELEEHLKKEPVHKDEIAWCVWDSLFKVLECEHKNRRLTCQLGA